MTIIEDTFYQTSEIEYINMLVSVLHDCYYVTGATTENEFENGLITGMMLSNANII